MARRTAADAGGPASTAADAGGPAPNPTLKAKTKPVLRGVMHSYAAVGASCAGAVLIHDAHGLEARLATSAYVASLVGLFIISSVYHRVDWTNDKFRERMRSLDHCAIFVLIAGTYTPVCVFGGVAYSLGAACYAAHGPNLAPSWGFGYHELFHLFVIVAAALHFWAVRLLLRAAEAAVPPPELRECAAQLG